MVILDYPDVSCRKFFKLENTFFGPIDPNGGYRGVEIDLPLSGTIMTQSKGISDENNVEHTSFEGRINYYPILADCLPRPTALYPHNVRIPILESPKYVDIVYGFGCPDVGAHVYAATNGEIYQTVLRDGSKWSLIKIIRQSTTSKCFIYRFDFSFRRWINSTSLEVSYGYSYSRTSKPWPFVAGSNETTHETIMNACLAVTDWYVAAPTVKSCPAYTTDPSAAKSPTVLQQHLEHFVNELMESVFPIPEVDYGELAARAVKQKNLMDMNLYEFLRDIPNAKDLIPKLKNLKDLKTHAGNFLAVKYGVLPTISDLETIIGAFKGRKPFFDKFGSEIFNASNKAELVKGSTTYTLAQYIKVPVANEDNQFHQLLDGLENFGLGLTFSNAWDLVKLSFVLDWFIDVGGFLERIDQNLRLARYNIPYVTMSRRKTIQGEITPLNGLALTGPIKWRYYHRWVSSHCPLPPLTLSLTPTVSNHWLEGGALLLQIAKK